MIVLVASRLAGVKVDRRNKLSQIRVHQPSVGVVVNHAAVPINTGEALRWWCPSQALPGIDDERVLSLLLQGRLFLEGSQCTRCSTSMQSHVNVSYSGDLVDNPLRKLRQLAVLLRGFVEKSTEGVKVRIPVHPANRVAMQHQPFFVLGHGDVRLAASKKTSVRVLRSKSKQAGKDGLRDRVVEERRGDVVSSYHLQALGVVRVLRLQAACNTTSMPAILSTIGLLSSEGEKVSHRRGCPKLMVKDIAIIRVVLLL